MISSILLLYSVIFRSFSISSLTCRAHSFFHSCFYSCSLFSPLVISHLVLFLALSVPPHFFNLRSLWLLSCSLYSINLCGVWLLSCPLYSTNSCGFWLLSCPLYSTNLCGFWLLSCPFYSSNLCGFWLLSCPLVVLFGVAIGWSIAGCYCLIYFLVSYR